MSKTKKEKNVLTVKLLFGHLDIFTSLSKTKTFLFNLFYLLYDN